MLFGHWPRADHWGHTARVFVHLICLLQAQERTLKARAFLRPGYQCRDESSTDVRGRLLFLGLSQTLRCMKCLAWLSHFPGGILNSSSWHDDSCAWWFWLRKQLWSSGQLEIVHCEVGVAFSLWRKAKEIQNAVNVHRFSGELITNFRTFFFTRQLSSKILNTLVPSWHNISHIRKGKSKQKQFATFQTELTIY